MGSVEYDNDKGKEREEENREEEENTLISRRVEELWLEEEWNGSERRVDLRKIHCVHV